VSYKNTSNLGNIPLATDLQRFDAPHRPPAWKIAYGEIQRPVIHSPDLAAPETEIEQQGMAIAGAWLADRGESNIEGTIWSPNWSRTGDHRMELNGTRRHAWPQFQIQISTWTDRPSPINAGTRRNSLVSKTANGTGINPAVRLKGHSARLPSGLLISPPSRQGFRPSPAAISSSLLLIPGLRGRGSRGAEPSTFCAPFAWLERNTTAPIIVSGVPPTSPRSPGKR
jgi:hypothetical protein